MSLPASLLLGALLGAAHAAAAFLVAGRARALETGRALRLVVSGMVARMALTLAAFAAVLVALPVRPGAFVGGFGAAFGLGLLAEVALALGRPAPPPDSLD